MTPEPLSYTFRRYDGAIATVDSSRRVETVYLDASETMTIVGPWRHVLTMEGVEREITGVQALALAKAHDDIAEAERVLREILSGRVGETNQ